MTIQWLNQMLNVTKFCFPDDSDDSEPQQKRLLKYVKDQETSVFVERLGLDKEMFALQFDPVMSQVSERKKGISQNCNI